MRQADPEIDFVAEVLAGRAPLDFGPAGPDRDRTIELLCFHRLCGLCYSDARAAGCDDPGAGLGAETSDLLRR